MERYYKIKTRKASYNCVIKTSRNGNLSVYLGGAKYVCLELVSNDLDIKKHGECFINARDENVMANDMMYALLYLLKKNHKELCKITLTDMSSNNYFGNLLSYYLAFYQETWYERDFCAILENENLREKYNKQKGVFQKKENSEEFLRGFLRGFLLRDLTKSDIDLVVKFYNESETYETFFKNLKNGVSHEKLGSLLKPWLDSFVKSVLDFSFINMKPWIINCEKSKECENPEMELNDDNFEIISLQNDPYDGKYLNIKKLIQNGGAKLSERQRRSFKNPRWIGWCDLDMNEYTEDDQEYLRECLKEF